jgi:hypothetical protein
LGNIEYTYIVELPNSLEASLISSILFAAKVFKTTFSAPALIISFICLTLLIPPPTENGIFASTPTFFTKSSGIFLFSLLAKISKKTNSSAFKSLNILTALIGSPIYLYLPNFTVLTSPKPLNNNAGITLGLYIIYIFVEKFFKISNPLS